MTQQMRDNILQLMEDVAKSCDATLISPISDSTELTKIGIDSLGFAILVARLELTLGFDPFSASDRPVFPQTFGEFVAMYQQEPTKK